MKLFFLKKSKAEKAPEQSPDKKLEYFRGLILGHLSGLEKEGDEDSAPETVQKALNFIEILAKGGKGLPVGTVREWSGKKYVKTAMASGNSPGKWRPKYDGETQGTKMAVSAIKRKIAEAKDAHEMMQIVLEHRDRFSDKEGHPLPFVMELHNYVMSEQDNREKAAEKKKRAAGTPKNKPQASKAVQPKGAETETGKETPEKPGIKEEAPEPKQGKTVSPKKWVDTYVKYNDGKITLREAYNILLDDVGGDPEFGMGGSYGDHFIDDLRKLTSGNRGILKHNGERYTNEDIKDIVLGKSPDPTEYLTPREGHLYAVEHNGKYRIHGAGKNGVYAATLMENENKPKEFDTMQSAINHIKELEDSTTPEKKGQEVRAVERNKSDPQENFKKISNILETGKSEAVHNENLGDITVDTGEAGKKGYGLKHIIEDRAREGRSEDEIAAILHLVIQAAREGKITREIHFKGNPEHKGRLELEKDGIVAILSRQRNKGDNEHWLLTGFDNHKKKEEATEAIQTVIAQYGHSPEFSGFRTQVGAVVSSLSTVSPESGEKSSPEPEETEEEKRRNAIRKAIDLENMERIAPESAGAIDAAIDGALRFFAGLRNGRGSFDRKKVVLNRAGESVEDYRWVMQKAEPDVQLAFYKQAITPHAALIQDDRGGEKIIAVDFDGVINSYISGWQGPTETDEPVLSAAEGISGLWNRGYKIIIFSTRASTSEGADTIREYIRKHTENDLLANSIEITDRKPIADVYIDDRAIPFTGNWEETLRQIEEFKPWIESADETEKENKYVFLKLDEDGLAVKFSDDINDFSLWNHYGFIPEPEHLEKLEREGIAGWTGNDTWYYIMQHDTWRYMNLDLHAKIDKSMVEKSLTWSGFPLQGRMKVQGMDISIENQKGSTRSGTDKDGHEWHTKMGYDYGYIRGTVGIDKDHLDCYLGPNPESEIIYIVNQNDPVTGKFDEQKVMLGFDSEEEAKAAYLKQYDRPGFFGDILKMDIDTFKEEAFSPGNKGKSLKRREK